MTIILQAVASNFLLHQAAVFVLGMYSCAVLHTVHNVNDVRSSSCVLVSMVETQLQTSSYVSPMKNKNPLLLTSLLHYSVGMNYIKNM